ncbi:MAG: hypothetical protein PHF84_06180 [bacterium]|nr:hypothetical protein [bacterium]
MSNPICEKIIDLLTPNLGKNMAIATLDVQTQKIGKTSDTLSRQDLFSLSEKIKTGIKIFVGTEKANEIAAKITNIN